MTIIDPYSTRSTDEDQWGDIFDDVLLAWYDKRMTARRGLPPDTAWDTEVLVDDDGVPIQWAIDASNGPVEPTYEVLTGTGALATRHLSGQHDQSTHGQSPMPVNE